MSNFLTLFPHRLSTTQDFEIYNRCSYQWFLSRCAYFTKYAYNIDLEFGGEFASAIEKVRVAYYKDGKSAEEALTIGINNIRDNFAINFAESNIADTLKTPEKMMEVLRAYFEEYPLDSTAIVPFELPNGEISVEQTFDIELPFLHPETSKPLVMSVKPDLIGMDRQGKFVLVDEKTSKQTGMNDYDKTVDCYRTKNQFVQYVFGINHNKEKFGDLKVTHMVIRRVVITAKAMKDMHVVEEYEFIIDEWFQQEWWRNTLLLVEQMLSTYKKYRQEAIGEYTGVTFKNSTPEFIFKESLPNNPFRKSYGNCEAFFKPCKFTGHCSSGSGQDLQALGFEQKVYDKETGTSIPLSEARKQLGLT
jgi:hypothetical protein